MKERGGMVQGLTSLDFGNHIVPSHLWWINRGAKVSRFTSEQFPRNHMHCENIQNFYCITCIEE